MTLDPTVQQYLIFETAAGFCGIAWNRLGITRFQLPASSFEATMRNLLRRLPRAEPGTSSPQVTQAVASAERYFAGEKISNFFPAVSGNRCRIATLRYGVLPSGT